MNRRRLEAIKLELRRCRRAPQKAIALQRLAKSLGRKLVKRGKEPTWESQVFDSLYPLSIPSHGSRDLAPMTQRSILNSLEGDVSAWEEKLGTNGSTDGEEDDAG